MAFGTRTRGAASSSSYTAIGGTSSSSRRPTTAPPKKERHGRKKGLTGSAPIGTDPHSDYQLYDVWRDLNADGRAFIHIATSGQSAARLDRWLISEHLRARVSADSQATEQVIGYPGDHLGVSLCLMAPRSTCYEAAAWRMPLHLLDDQPFCDRLTEEIPAYLTAHPLGLELSRGHRWENLKRHIKDIALQRSWALAAQRRASQTALKPDSRAALTQYTSSPSIVWQYYGEQSTFWFHHLAKERQSRTEIKALRTGGAPDSPPVLLDTPAGRNQGSTLLRGFYSGHSATGLFAARPVSQPAEAELLEALDKSLTPEAAATAEGTSGDGSIPITELEAALRSMPRGKAPGLDGISYEFNVPYAFAQVRDATGQPIALEAWARQGLVRVSDLRTLVHTTTFCRCTSARYSAAARRMFVHGPPSAGQWLASPGTANCRVWSRSADGSYTCTHTASSSGALVPVPAGSEEPQQPLPATAQPVLVLGWNITRPWHPRHSTPRTQEEQQDQGDPPAQSQEDQQHQDDQPAQHQPAPPYLFGFWGTHMVNPTSWGLGKRPAHQYVVKEATQRRQVLHRLKHGHPQSPVRPAIWADSTDDQRSGLRAIEAHWASTAAGTGASQQSFGKRRRGEPDPSSHAAWMSPPPKRPPPWRDRPHPQPSAPAPRLQRQQCSPDTVDAAAVARGPQPPWAHVWRVIATSHLDRGQRMTVWRLLHGKLFVGAFTRHIHRSEPAGYTYSHPLCTQEEATLTHVFITYFFLKNRETSLLQA
ncbi:hypothetical protein COCOBI_11-1640 [Coccomyxa sp. Obi]|nr:hypothetical protein COCOBI_11-1640 [Coccomyxa sp. Obi]